MFSWGEDHRACTRQHRQTSEPRSWHWIFIATSAEKHYFSSTTYDKRKHFFTSREETVTYVPTNQQISITERNGHFYIPLKELQSGDAKTDEDESAQGSNEQQPFLGFAGTVETDEDTLQYQRKTITTYRARGALRTISIKHTVISTESHEKVAEAHFSWLSKAIYAQLYGARLSPVSWTDATTYACYLHFRIPCLEIEYAIKHKTEISIRNLARNCLRRFDSSACS
jgi:hypothetical protein